MELATATGTHIRRIQGRNLPSFAGFRSVGASLAGLIVGALVPLIVYDTGEDGSQIVKPVSFTVTAIVFGILSVACYILCYSLCRERVSFEKKESQKEGVGAMLAGLFVVIGHNWPVFFQFKGGKGDFSFRALQKPPDIGVMPSDADGRHQDGPYPDGF